jgi:putative MATE family efflux protein
LVDKGKTVSTGKDRPQNAQNKMGIMSEGRLLITMSVPAMISMLIQAFYNVIDSVFVAQLGEDALAAISLIFPVQMLMVAVGVGTGVGINSVIARRLGEGNLESAGDASAHGLLLALANWVVFAIFGLFIVTPFVSAFSDSPAVIEYGRQYLSIISVFSLPMMVQLKIEKILQATGNMILPMVCSLIGALTKTILNPILVFGLLGAPKLGISGAAIATVLGNTVAMVFGLILFFGKDHEVTIRFKGFRLQKQILKDIYAVGVPAIAMQSIVSVMVAGLNSILIQYSQAAVAVLGVYFRLQNFIFMPVFGLMQGAMPIFGFNFGAKKKDRLMRSYRLVLIFAVSLMLVGVAIFMIFPVALMRLFNASEEMMHIGVRAMRILSLCFVPAAFGITNSTLFQALGHGVPSLLVSLLRQLILILPLAWVLALFGGVDTVWLSFPLAEIISTIASLLLLRYLYKKEIQPL